MDNKAISCR